MIHSRRGRPTISTGDRTAGRNSRRAGERGRRRALNARREGGGDGQNVVGVAEARPGRGGCGSRRRTEDGQGVARRFRAAKHHSAQRPLRREQGMNDGADRHHAKAWLILIVFVVEARQRLGAGLAGRIVERIFSRGARAAAHARGGGESEDGNSGKAAPKRDCRPWRDRKDAARDRQHGVADHPAETGGQGPAAGRRKQRSQPRRRDHAAQIEADFQARPIEPPLGDAGSSPRTRAAPAAPPRQGR